MKVFVNGHEFKNWKILDGYLYVKCGFGYTLANALVESGYIVEIKENENWIKTEAPDYKGKYPVHCWESGVFVLFYWEIIVWKK